MKKKIIILFAILTMGLTACSDENILEKNQTATIKNEESIEKKGENAVVYRIDEETGEIISESKEIKELNEKEIWKLLKATGMLEEETEVLSLKKNGSKLELDLNQAFGEQLRSYGTAGEQEILSCVVNTFLDTYHCTEIRITEEGKILLSGHAEYDEYFQRFE